MPKITKHPRLRTKVYKGASGQAYVYYVYDMRPEGKPDIRLGKDHATAIARWDELHNRKPRLKGTIEEAFQLWETEKLPAYTSEETRKGYARNLRKLRVKFSVPGSETTWDVVKMRHLVAYLETRKGKTQANREISLFQVIWNFARIKGLTELPWPAAGMERSKWKNPERAREVEVTDAMFEAIHAQGDQILRDAMDIASATGMRVKDVRTIPLPPGDELRLKASKTGKKTDFTISLSAVLPDVIQRRRANKKALHLKLLAAPGGREVSYRMLCDRFAEAREKAALKALKDDQRDLATAIRAMVLRDCRKYAADLAGSAEDAQKLLQHGNVATTLRHYRTRADQAKPVR
jgi:hypothetical protein